DRDDADIEMLKVDEDLIFISEDEANYIVFNVREFKITQTIPTGRPSTSFRTPKYETFSGEYKNCVQTSDDKNDIVHCADYKLRRYVVAKDRTSLIIDEKEPDPSFSSGLVEIYKVRDKDKKEYILVTESENVRVYDVGGQEKVSHVDLNARTHQVKFSPSFASIFYIGECDSDATTNDCVYKLIKRDVFDASEETVNLQSVPPSILADFNVRVEILDFDEINKRVLIKTETPGLDRKAILWLSTDGTNSARIVYSENSAE
ncbi:hypothetical protein N9D31_03600, partial [Oligoflexaceae bacterium]|nr:hypothetical protein [Oligoflexaceae bacterium]